MRYLAPIIEGHGEIESVPALLHRVARHSGFTDVLLVNAPIRVKLGSFLNDKSYFTRHVTLAAGKAAERGGAGLILLDCDDDCPAVLGPRILKDAQETRPDVPFIVVLAHREFESWFIAGVESLRGLNGLSNDLTRPLHLEDIRDAKGWLSARMAGGYDPVVHQLEFSRRLDIDEAKNSQSFKRFFDRIVKFLTP